MDAERLGDETLVERFLGGAQGAFDELMRRHEDRVFSVTYRITGNRADALDAAQDAFVAAFRRLGSFRGESSFGTWLYRIAVNAATDVVRGRNRRPQPSGDPPEPREDVSSGADIEDVVGNRIDVARALTELPDDYREAVVLHDIAGIPYDEIASMTAVPIGTVKSRISRGRRMLASTLEQARVPSTSKDER